MTPGSDAAAWLKTAIAYEIRAKKLGEVVADKPKFHIPTFSTPARYRGNAICARCGAELTLRRLVDRSAVRAREGRRVMSRPTSIRVAQRMLDIGVDTFPADHVRDILVLTERLLAFVESYAEPATDLVAKLAVLDAEADAIIKEIMER